MRFYAIFLLFWIIGVVIVPKTESCLPSWFRKTRSSEPEANGLQAKAEETNEIGEEKGLDLTTTTTLTPYIEDDEKKKEEKMNSTMTNDEIYEKMGNELEEAVKGVVETEAEYAYEYEDEVKDGENGSKETDGLKYNEDATKEVSSTMKPEVRREIEKLKDAKCKDYCHHNATCHVEVIFRDDRVSAVVPSCHCPHGWEGLRCDRHYVQAFYAPVSRYNVRLTTSAVALQDTELMRVNTRTRVANITGTIRKQNESAGGTTFTNIREFLWQSSTSAIPAFAFLVVMLLMFIAIVVYAYRRMSRRIDETTYTMSQMCPPEAFTVLKTPNGRKISVHHESMFVATSSSAQPSSVVPNSVQRGPGRAMAMKTKSNDANRNNFLAILRNQGTIPSRNINEDDTPKHYKSVPRVDVSAINYSGHIDFSSISYSSEEPSQDHRTNVPHIAIDIDGGGPQTSRCHSRADGEPSTPTTSQPMIFNNQ